ncbi:unnamed protein product [Albugo candida]|uniref:Uncharacterized protein n=1 Tax=Albugo candida TaxID=65357 RepID=A0A024GKD8_9STRA|nr:unnamed protein product [Albugo candida]|eukprot:CCI46964.1 unnamed protein product [Albugo candida]
MSIQIALRLDQIALRPFDETQDSDMHQLRLFGIRLQSLKTLGLLFVSALYRVHSSVSTTTTDVIFRDQHFVKAMLDGDKRTQIVIKSESRTAVIITGNALQTNLFNLRALNLFLDNADRMIRFLMQVYANFRRYALRNIAFYWILIFQKRKTVIPGCT